MAGGMTGGGWGKRGMGIPLAQRVRVGSTPAAATTPGPTHPASPPSPGSDPGGSPSPARHCWVADGVDGEGVKRPGLLVEWRQGADGWEGRVVYSARLGGLVADPGRAWGVVEEWLPADRLTPR